MELKRRKKLRPTIPLSAMADIAFLLLVFFICTSAMNMEDTAEIRIPSVPKIETIEQGNRLDLWMDKAGTLRIMRKACDIEEAEIHIVQRMRLAPATVVFLNSDERCPFNRTETVLKMLSRAGAVKIVFATREEKPDEKP